jgi:uncharacterized protein (TIGR02246 family)
MSRPWASVTLLALLGACAQPRDATRHDVSLDAQAVREVLYRFRVADRADDVVAIGSLFAPDAVYIADGTTLIRGQQAVYTALRDLYEKYTWSATVEPVEVRVTGDSAIARARVSGHLFPRTQLPPSWWKWSRRSSYGAMVPRVGDWFG